MKRLIFLPLVLIPCFIASAQVDTAIIRGKVNSGNCKSIKVDMLRDNPINIFQKTFSAPVNNRGEFTLKVPISRLATGRICVGQHVHDICLLPSDNIFADIDGSKIKYTGKGSEKNNFLYFLERKGYQTRNYFQESNSTKLSPKEFALKMKEFRDHRMELINNYSGEHSLDKYSSYHPLEETFTDYFRVENSAIYLALLNDYPERYAFKHKLKEDSLKLTPEYYKYRQLKNIANDKYVVSPNYVDFLWNYLFTEARLLRTGNVKNIFNNPFYVVMNDSLTGKSQEYIMAKWLCSDLAFQKKIDTVIYRKFKEIAKDPVAISTVADAIEKHHQKEALIGQPLNEAFRETQVEDTLGRVLSFVKLLEQYKGKVVYLDIWGLGCGPCRVSMPFSKKLKEKLSGQPIEFVYLTTDKKYKNLWQDVFKVSQTNKNHYRLCDGIDCRFLQMMEISWVPSYMIFDKEGKLVDYSAPGPGSFLIYSKLLKLAAIID